MMIGKIIDIKFVLLVLFSMSVSAQGWIPFQSTLQVAYEVQYKGDSLSNNLTKDRVTLYIGDEKSIYQNDKKHKIDSMRASNPTFVIPPNPMFLTSYVIHKDRGLHTIKFSDELEGVNFYYKEDFPPMKWKILSDKQVISGFNCQKATTKFRGRQYFAWFTADIPIQEGPYKFGGLPGLIVLLHDEKNDYRFEVIGIERRNKQIFYQTPNMLVPRKKIIEAKINLIKKYSKRPIASNPIELE